MSHNFIPGIATQSLGCPSKHPLIPKIHAAARAGLQSLEVFYEDIQNLTTDVLSDSSLLPPSLPVLSAGSSFPSSTKRQETELAVCNYISEICTSLSLSIICLQPFMHYEGLLSHDEHTSRLTKLRYWIQLAHRLRTDLIQIPSNFLPAHLLTSSRTQIVQDLREAADIGLNSSPPIRFAYEALAWGTHVSLWNDAFDIVREVDRPNFGTCLDSFNLAGRVYADPTSQTGRVEDADKAIATSLTNLRQVLSDPANLDKVFYVELCDGERLARPISKTHEWYHPEQPARMTWSRNARLFPFETDATEAQCQGREVGYLPITDVFDVILDAGYMGYISFEVFNRSLNKDGKEVVSEHAERARVSWKRCCQYVDQRLQQKDETEDQEYEPQQFQQIHPSLSSRTGITDFNSIASRL